MNNINNLSNQQIIRLANKVSGLILSGDDKTAIQKLKPVLDTKCPFPKLDLLGKQIGKSDAGQPQKFFKAFDRVIDYNAMGSFVVVGQALICFLENDFKKVIKKSRDYIIKGDKWYVCDIIGERSLGHALINYFDETLPLLDIFLKDENKWVKRSVGVAMHFFTKRILNEPEKNKKLLNLIEPYIEEKQIDVVKGIGWGLKTTGKYHPDILAEFLKRQIKAKKKISRLMMRKAVTYLDKNKRSAIGIYV